MVFVKVVTNATVLIKIVAKDGGFCIKLSGPPEEGFGSNPLIRLTGSLTKGRSADRFGSGPKPPLVRSMYGRKSTQVQKIVTECAMLKQFIAYPINFHLYGLTKIFEISYLYRMFDLFKVGRETERQTIVDAHLP